MIKYIKVQEQSGSITKICCPTCNEKLPRIGLTKESKIKGLSFKCRRCGDIFEVTTE